MGVGHIGRPGIRVRTRVETGPVSGHVPAATQYLNMAGIPVKDILTIPKLAIMGRVLVRKRKVVFFRNLLTICNEATRNDLIQHTVMQSLHIHSLLCFVFVCLFACLFVFVFFVQWGRF